jgi:UDP-glucose 6-dehydrogenase
MMKITIAGTGFVGLANAGCEGGDEKIRFIGI